MTPPNRPPRAPSPSRSELVALDKRHVWHPYTPMGPYLEATDPLVVVRAEGSRFFDANGRSYLDASSSWYCAALGHRHPRLVQALTEQAETLAHVVLAGVTHEPAVRLAAELSAATPGALPHVFFSDDGSTAVETALKLAAQYWAQNGRTERRRFVALDGAFHGETLGATYLSGIELFRRAFAGLIGDCLRVPSTEGGYARAFDVLGELLRAHSDEIAAVVLEPVVQGAGGMRIYDPGLLRAARELTERHDVFLVLDEVFTGYGRTGPMWAAEHAAVAPDILCVGKAFSGGLLPMAATLASARIFEGFLGDRSRAFFHGHTYCGNPLGARVALEVLAVFRDERIVERAQPKAARLAARFARLAELPGVSNVRSLGMVAALDLNAEGYLDGAGWRVYEEALARGAYLRPLGSTVYVTPPLTIADDELEELCDIVEASVGAVTRR
ncbi:MAG TPA: adenosylmethionine--8-amino-7-oxononanoate transaminase [Polyangiaceae bacterium]|nr:adenosylmethionine--8-amino-7-oxononanoate transaminase [Polyangiaceae bacterium]